MMYHKWGVANRAHLLSKWQEQHQTHFMLGLPKNLVFPQTAVVLHEVGSEAPPQVKYHGFMESRFMLVRKTSDQIYNDILLMSS